MNDAKKHKKKPQLVRKWEKQIELEEKLEKILPEKEPVAFEGKPIEKFTASWQEGKDVKVITERPMEIRRYEVKKRPTLIPLFNINHTKVYFDTKSSEFWQYVFSPNRKRILRKVKLEKHDILNMLAFCIWAIYPDKPMNSRSYLYLPYRLRQRITKLKTKWYEHYTWKEETI